jgi:hypothetical protein
MCEWPVRRVRRVRSAACQLCVGRKHFALGTSHSDVARGTSHSSTSHVSLRTSHSHDPPLSRLSRLLRLCPAACGGRRLGRLGGRGLALLRKATGHLRCRGAKLGTDREGQFLGSCVLAWHLHGVEYTSATQRPRTCGPRTFTTNVRRAQPRTGSHPRLARTRQAPARPAVGGTPAAGRGGDTGG